MRTRLVLLLAALTVGALASCGTPNPTPQQICGDAGCDVCIGATCPADAGP